MVVVATNHLTRGGIFFKGESFVIHEDFNRELRTNDIAIIVIDGIVRIGDIVSPIDLDNSFVGNNVPATLTGWGTSNVSDVLT
jgi:hypothetical protein